MTKQKVENNLNTNLEQEIKERLDKLEEVYFNNEKDELTEALLDVKRKKDLSKRITRTQKYEELRKELESTDILETFTDNLEELEKKLNLIADKTKLKELEKIKRAYNKRALKSQGKAQKLNTYNNALLENDKAFNIDPIVITEKNNLIVKVKSTESETFKLTHNDRKLDTIIANIVENATEELKEKDYIERTLLNIANEFYSPTKPIHYSDNQLKEIFELLTRNMKPLYFEYENGEKVISPLINIQIRKDKANATETIKIFKTQYISEYNKKAEGLRTIKYIPNLKDDLNLQYKLKDSELAETIRSNYLDKKVNTILFNELESFYNADNRTEKKRFKEKLIDILKGYANIYGVTDPKEIKKNSKSKEVIGLKFRYLK